MSMIENALYYTNPPVATRVTLDHMVSCDELLSQVVRKQRPPLQEFMRKLLYKDLNRANTEKVFYRYLISIYYRPDIGHCIIVNS